MIEFAKEKNLNPTWWQNYMADNGGCYSFGQKPFKSRRSSNKGLHKYYTTYRSLNEGN